MRAYDAETIEKTTLRGKALMYALENDKVIMIPKRKWYSFFVDPETEDVTKLRGKQLEEAEKNGKIIKEIDYRRNMVTAQPPQPSGS